MSETPPSSFARSAIRVLGALFILLLATSLAGLWYYCVDSKHSTPESIGDGRILELTPPAAHDITLDRDFLDHYATYTVTERELTAFLNRTFEVEDSFSERENIAEIKVGKAIGRLGWVVPEGCVVYSYAAGYGGVSTYYHDPATGSTYQESAHW